MTSAKLPADQLASRIAAQGLCCVQLAVNKAIAGLDLTPAGTTSIPVSPGTIGRAFARHNLKSPSSVATINLSHPDPAARDPLIAFFKEHLRYARDFGGSIVATETGSLNPDWSFHSDNPSESAYRALVPVIAGLVAEAEHFGTIVGIEAVASHVLNSPRAHPPPTRRHPVPQSANRL